MCESLPLFELGHSHYEQYLLNLRLPVSGDVDNNDMNVELGEVGSLDEIWIFVSAS